MKRSRAVLSYPSWPPQLLITKQHKALLAQQLHAYSISVAAFIQGQLASARKDTLTKIGQTAHLTQDDIKKIKTLTGIVKEYDARAAQGSFLYRKDDYQEEMIEHFAGIQRLINTFKVDTDFNIYYDPEFHLDTYYDRSHNGIIFTLDDALILAHPEHNEYISRPELTIGPLFFELTQDEQWGTLARQIAGHIAFEHATERYLLKEVMKKRKVTPNAAGSSLSKLQLLHALEADLVPASHNSTFARYVLSWLKLQRNAANVPCIKDRIENVKAVLDLHVAYDVIPNKKYY